MITQNNTIKCEVSDFVKVQKELSAKLFYFSLAALIIGIAGTLAYIVLGTIFEDAGWVEILLVFCVPLAIGLVFLLSRRSLIKQSLKNIGSTNIYEFFSDCLIMRETRGGMEIAVVRVNYGDIVKVKETANYIFFFYRIKSTAYPIDKSTLTAAEINTVKKLFGRQTACDSQIINLPECSSAEVLQNNNQQTP